MELADLKTVEGAKQFVREFFPKFKENIEKDGELHPVSFLFITVDPQTGEALDQPGVVPVMTPGFRNNEEKDAFAAVLQEAVKRFRAICVVNVVEAWMVSIDTKDEAKMRDYMNGNKGASQHPDRKEMVIVTIEHVKMQGGSQMFCAPISRTNDGKPVVGEFEDKGINKSAGRFQGFLQHIN